MSIAFKQARNYTKGRIKKIRLIVIHDMEAPEAANTAENVASWMAGATAPRASYHYGVDSNSIVQSVRDYDTAWHCPGANADGLGIEHAGVAKQTRRDWTDGFSRATLARSAKLTAGLAKKYGIPVRRLTAAQIRDGKAKGFAGHVDVSNALGTVGGHTDPGPNFPWDVYLKMVQAELDALNGRAWSKAKIAAAAAASAVVIAVFGGVTQTDNPAPAPKPTVVKFVPKPVPTKTPIKVTPKPVKKATTAKTLGAFPLPAGQYYGLTGRKDKAAVIKIQKAVGATADGQFGPRTEAKVKAKQRRLGLRADGKVGRITWSHLRLP